jgi:hypothetical protein
MIERLRGERNKMTGKITLAIIAILAISMLALGVSILPTDVYAQADAYSKGYKDATCDAALCNGHGYDPSCQGDHSSEYCVNYSDGYAAGWDASTNANSDGQQRHSPPPFPQSQAPSSDWTLTVNAVNVPFGDSNIHFSILGPFGYRNSDNIPNSQYPSTSFDMPGNQFPTGYRYQVCISSSALGWLLPHCVYYRHGEGDEAVSISPY